KEAVKVNYLARTKFPGKPHFFKAGNLQFGLAESTRDGFISEYIAALDVDAITQSDWLRRIIPHLILDSKLALVNPAQVSWTLFLCPPFGFCDLPDIAGLVNLNNDDTRAIIICLMTIFSAKIAPHLECGVNACGMISGFQ